MFSPDTERMNFRQGTELCSSKERPANVKKGAKIPTTQRDQLSKHSASMFQIQRVFLSAKMNRKGNILTTKLSVIYSNLRLLLTYSLPTHRLFIVLETKTFLKSHMFAIEISLDLVKKGDPY